MYNKSPQRVIADSGYGSKENYEYLKERDIEGYVKYNYFHKEQKKSFTNENEGKEYIVDGQQRLTTLTGS